jgi:membrane protein
MRIKDRIQQIRSMVIAKWDVVRTRLNRIRPRFLGRAGLADILVFFYKGMTHQRFTLNAMAMAYRFFFGVFPGLILIFTLVPAIPVDNLQAQVRGLMSAVIPGDSMGFIDNILGEFFSKPSAGLISINIALLLFSTMGGIKVMMSAFSKDSHHFARRNVFVFNFVALILLLGMLVIFLGTIALMVLQEVSIHYFEKHGMIAGGSWESFMIRAGFWVMIYIALLLAVALLYWLGPNTRKRGRFLSPGAIAGSVMILVAVTAFRLFFAQFTNYNKIYGSLSAIMVLMVWFYWISIVLLIGFELNAAILAASGNMVGEPDEKTDGEIERRREGDLIDERRSQGTKK